MIRPILFALPLALAGTGAAPAAETSPKTAYAVPTFTAAPGPQAPGPVAPPPEGDPGPGPGRAPAAPAGRAGLRLYLRREPVSTHPLGSELWMHVEATGPGVPAPESVSFRVQGRVGDQGREGVRLAWYESRDPRSRYRTVVPVAGEVQVRAIVSLAGGAGTLFLDATSPPPEP